MVDSCWRVALSAAMKIVALTVLGFCYSPTECLISAILDDSLTVNSPTRTRAWIEGQEEQPNGPSR
jgi:hypothetical protein